MLEKIGSISTQIKPNTLGIIWSTTNDLTLNSQGLYEFNYLLDGIITKSLIELPAQKTSFFLGKNFGNLFFILQNNKENKIEDSFDILDSMLSQSEGEVFIYPPQDDLVKKLKKKYPAIEFNNLVAL
jgi:hypothetical protein